MTSQANNPLYISSPPLGAPRGAVFLRCPRGFFELSILTVELQRADYSAEPTIKPFAAAHDEPPPSWGSGELVQIPTVVLRHPRGVMLESKNHESRAPSSLSTAIYLAEAGI